MRITQWLRVVYFVADFLFRIEGLEEDRKPAGRRAVKRPGSNWRKISGQRRIRDVLRVAMSMEWRERQKEVGKKVIQDKIPSSKPWYKLVLLVPGGIKTSMIQDKIILERVKGRVFWAHGGG